MARRKRGLIRSIVVVLVIALAVFGGYVVYQDNQDEINVQYDHVAKKARAVKRAIER